MIGKVIKSIFTSDSDLSTLFSGRVYPVVGAQGKDNPMVVYDVTNIITNGSKDADTHIDDVDVRFTIIAKTYSDIDLGTDYIRSAFVRLNTTIGGVAVQSCEFEGKRDIFSEDEHTFGGQVDLQFRIVK